MGWGSLPFPPTPPFFIIPNQPFLLFLTQILPNDNKTMSSKGLETRILGFHSMSANSLGQSMALFLFQYISPPLHSLEQEAKGFAGITKCPIPKGIPEGIPRGTENPELPRKASSDNIRKGTDRKKGIRVGAAQAGTQGLSAEQKPHLRHTHLPAEAPQSALAGDACGHSKQRSRPRPESQKPTALPFRASWQEWSRQEVLLQESFSVRKLTRLDANPV